MQNIFCKITILGRFTCNYMFHLFCYVIVYEHYFFNFNLPFTTSLPMILKYNNQQYRQTLNSVYFHISYCTPKVIGQTVVSLLDLLSYNYTSYTKSYFLQAIPISHKTIHATSTTVTTWTRPLLCTAYAETSYTFV